MLQDYMNYSLNQLVNPFVFVKLLNENAKIPTRGSEEAAGYDLYSTDEIMIKPGETKPIHTGIAIALPKKTFGGIYARSGMAIKRGLRPANCVGVIDSDYRGEVIVALHNDSDETQMIHVGDRIAQLIVQEYKTVTMTEAENLDDTARGEGGFGSTGTN